LSWWADWPTQGQWTGGETATDEGPKAAVGHLKTPGVWSYAEYDTIRRHLADCLVKLQ